MCDYSRQTSGVGVGWSPNRGRFDLVAGGIVPTPPNTWGTWEPTPVRFRTHAIPEELQTVDQVGAALAAGLTVTIPRLAKEDPWGNPDGLLTMSLFRRLSADPVAFAEKYLTNTPTAEKLYAWNQQPRPVLPTGGPKHLPAVDRPDA